MGLVIANNVSSLNAQHHLSRSSQGLSKSLERLSSGFKVNRGADGPAALVISEKQRAQIAGLRKAIENSDKAVSLVQTAEGALNEINSLLIRIRALALDSSNTGVNDQNALEANNAEIKNALETINRIASNTQFGTRNLLDGSSGYEGVATDNDVTFLKAAAQTIEGAYLVEVTTPGSRAAATATVDQTAALAADEELFINDVRISLAQGLTKTEVIARINSFSSQTGVIAEDTASGTRLYTIPYGSDVTLKVSSNVAAAADSSGFGTAVVTAVGTNVVGTIGGVSYVGKGNVLTANTGAANGLSIQLAADPADAAVTVDGAQGSVSVINNSLRFQIGANAGQTASIAIDRATPTGLGLGVVGNQFNNLNEVDVTSFKKAQDTIKIVDAAIGEITKLRGELGAFQQNSLESTTNSLRATLENSINADSVIRDTDFAEEIANFTKQQVLVQAGTSVLSNANQASQLVLSLLR